MINYFQAEAELRQAQSDFDRQQEITRLLLEGVSTAHVSVLSNFQDLNSAVYCLFILFIIMDKLYGTFEHPLFINVVIFDVLCLDLSGNSVSFLWLSAGKPLDSFTKLR